MEYGGRMVLYSVTAHLLGSDRNAGGIQRRRKHADAVCKCRSHHQISLSRKQPDTEMALYGLKGAEKSALTLY